MIRTTTAALAAMMIAGCASPGDAPGTQRGRTPAEIAPIPAYTALAHADAARVLDRVTWGTDASSERHVRDIGIPAFMEEQITASAGPMPAFAQATIDSMTISKRSPADLAVETELQRRGAQAMTDEAAKKDALREYQQQMTGYAREAASRTMLRAIYSPNQLQEQMAWFWTNHFNVFQRKANLRVFVGDYEESAIRPYTLGRFRDLVGATLRHPAMLRYLDNAQNAAGKINENYARELLELHTMGVDGGYTQRDVQELARVLTGVGLRAGKFEFHPRLHDMGDKVILGHTIHGRGLAEVDEVLDILCRHPSTARFVSRKLVVFFVSDDPPQALVERVADTYMRTDGDIKSMLRTIFASDEFARSLGTKFKDPMHYVVSSARLALDGRPLPDTTPLLGALARLGQLPNDHQTPDGYPLVEAAWASPGQMVTRFEFAQAAATRTKMPLEAFAKPEFMYR
jgi:uncharacterized protein (DUF1800 family)